MVKAIFFDVDGTLVSFRTHTIPPKTKRALLALREKGIRLFVSTGRHRRILSEEVRAFPFDGWITLSGQYCCCGGRVIRSVPMEPVAVEELVAAAGANGFSCIFFEEEDIYVNRLSASARRLLDGLGLEAPPVREVSYALGRDIFQVIAVLSGEEEHLLLDAAPHIKTTRWHPLFMDVIPAAGGKDLGVDAVLDYFHIPLEQSMAFGDGENDLTMLRRVGTGVAMGSASAAVKAQADYVTGSVDENGIPAALEALGVL